MKIYQTLKRRCIYIDGKSIPTTTKNKDYRQALAEVERGESQILPYSPPVDLAYWEQLIQNLYSEAMRKLQGDYTDEEVKTFSAKQDAITEYISGGLGSLSPSNRLMLEELTGSSDDLIITAKLERMVVASSQFKQYLAQIERLRDEHLDQLVDNQDNQSIVDALRAAYNI